MFQSTAECVLLSRADVLDRYGPASPAPKRHAPFIPMDQALILTHMLQTEMKSKVNAFKERLQREPAFPNGSPARRTIMGTRKTSHPGVRIPSRRSRWSSWQALVQSAGPPLQASAAQSPRERGALGLHERRHAPATSVRQAGTTDPTSGSDRQRFAIAVLQRDTHF